MNVVRFNPMRELDIFSNPFSRWLDGGFFPSIKMDDEVFRNWKPAVDIYADDEKITITAELPGVDKKDIHVDLKDGILTLSGERTYENEVKEEKYHRKERAHGKFYRSFALPEGADVDKIDADYKDGVLKIVIGKREEIKPKKVEIH
ncbi:MAG: Hsp20/alpha crystallin family protein [Thermodesulfobacteriota bacterium]|nr:Hsp20/alpha crystallin family protein [Thermodesulfobacteriota bacterium]